MTLAFLKPKVLQAKDFHNNLRLNGIWVQINLFTSRSETSSKH